MTGRSKIQTPVTSTPQFQTEAIQNALDSGNTMEEAMKTSSQEELNDLIENNQDAYKEYA